MNETPRGNESGKILIVNEMAVTKVVAAMAMRVVF